MNSILTIDKLIIRFIINSEQKLNFFYFNDKFSNENGIYFINNKTQAYIVKDARQHNEIIDSKLKLAVEYKNEDLGILYLDCANPQDFYFKIAKKIFYSKKYNIKQVVNLVSNLFDLDYNPCAISRCDIALDTITSAINDAYIIADICINNKFFKSLEISKTLESSANEYNGRVIGDAKYGLTIPKLSIYNHPTITNMTIIGKQSGDSFIRCYVKTAKSEPYQLDYFKQFFGDQDVYRLEVSVSTVGVTKANIDINQLDIPNYLKDKYFQLCQKKLTFNKLDTPFKLKGKIKYHQVKLLENVDFGTLSEVGTKNDNSLDDSYILLKKNVFRNNVKQNRASISKKIGEYFRSDGKVEDLINVIDLVSKNILNYNSGKFSLEKNIKVAKVIAGKQLSRNNSANGIRIFNLLIDRLDSLIFKNERSGTTIITTKEVFRSGKKSGINLKMIETNYIPDDTDE